MRRNRGLSSLQGDVNRSTAYNALGAAVDTREAERMRKELNALQRGLEGFARRHGARIARDSVFRGRFAAMCAQVGVDPLGSGVGLGEWTHALGVQIVDVCMATRTQNGGLLGMEELLARLEKLRGSTVSEEDVERALGELGALGGGYRVLQVGGRRVIESGGMGADDSVLEAVGTAQPCVSAGDAAAVLGHPASSLLWAAHTIHGLVWIDHAEGDTLFWAPAACEFR